MIQFPPVDAADEDGLLAMGGDLEVETLLTAYRSGIFPWPIEENFPLLWFAPPQRALLFFDEHLVPRRLRRALKNSNFETRVNYDFAAVIHACSAVPRPDQGTWIIRRMVEAYIRLHHAGYAISVETYENGVLAGGLYGVLIGRYFCGESMFHHRDNASKAAFVRLVGFLKERGVSWLDAQMMTPLLASFGAREVPRDEFIKLLREAIAPDENGVAAN